MLPPNPRLGSLQSRKPRQRQVKQLAPGGRAGKWQSRDLNTSSWAPPQKDASPSLVHLPSRKVSSCVMPAPVIHHVRRRGLIVSFICVSDDLIFSPTRRVLRSWGFVTPVSSLAFSLARRIRFLLCKDGWANNLHEWISDLQVHFSCTSWWGPAPSSPDLAHVHG